MALLWSKTVANTVYQVRSAGQSRRLYTNGVLHSAFHPQRYITGCVWDLLFLPALLYPPNSIQRVLVLGVGGGAVIHLLNRYAPPQSIIGIDIDTVHLRVAKKHFQLKYPNLELIHADAIHWVDHYRGPKFDMIIEDVFIEQHGEPMRLQHNDHQWLLRLQRLLTSSGLLVVNHATTVEARFSKMHSSSYATVYQFSMSGFENRVLAFCRQMVNHADMRERLQQHNELLHYRKQGVLRYHCRRINAFADNEKIRQK